MAAYNLVNGVPATENVLLLQKTLRAQWGFRGFVVSDWGAVNDHINGVNAGLNLEMPGSAAYHRSRIIEGVGTGQIPPQVLDEVVASLLAVVLEAKDRHRPGTTFDLAQHDALARKAAGESLVLLKNEGKLLPLEIGKT
jgi:beta-glucosidase